MLQQNVLQLVDKPALLAMKQVQRQEIPAFKSRFKLDIWILSSHGKRPIKALALLLLEYQLDRDAFESERLP